MMIHDLGNVLTTYRALAEKSHTHRHGSCPPSLPSAFHVLSDVRFGGRCGRRGGMQDFVTARVIARQTFRPRIDRGEDILWPLPKPGTDRCERRIYGMGRRSKRTSKMRDHIAAMKQTTVQLTLTAL